ncbi:MAG: hypothetical protein ACI97A_000203 [Planctomycetota bacterium]|jgi:hypothetical protein
MTQSSTLVKVIALLLMLLVGQRGWALISLSQNASELESLFEAEKAKENEADLIARLNVLAENRSSLSEKQKNKLDPMHSRITRAHLDNSLLLSLGPDDSISLSKVSLGGGLILGSSAATKLLVSLKSKANEKNILSGLEINGSPLDDKNSSVQIKIPDAKESATEEIRVSAVLGNGIKRDYEVQLRRDNSPPQIRFLIEGRGLVELDEAGRIGLKHDEKIDVIVQDETLVRSVSFIDQGSGKETKFINEMNPRFQHTFDSSTGTSRYAVVAEDWASNSSRFEFTFGKWRRPAPKIETIKCGEQDLTNGQVGWSSSALVDIALAFKDNEQGHRIFLNAKDQKYKMLALSNGHKATAVNLGNDGTWIGEIMLDQGDRQLSLGKVRIRVDQVPPTIQVIDTQKSDPKIASPVDARRGSKWSIKIEDNDELQATSATATPRSSMRVSRKKTLISLHEYDVKVEAGGAISITATDKAGNTTTKKLTFNLIAQLGPNDGKSPAVSLWYKDRQIPAEERVFFWGKAPNARLRIQDPSGIDLESLELERCTALSQSKDKSPTDLSMPVHLESDPFIKVSDSYGKETRRAFQIQVVSDSARIVIDAKDGVVKKLPFRFDFNIAEVVPPDLVSIELISPGGQSSPLKVGEEGIKNQGVVTALPGGEDGEWRIRLRFKAFDGLKNIAEAKFIAQIGEEKVE